jgi:organic radical activating enzyme
VLKNNKPMMKGYVSEIFRSFQGEGLFAGRRHVFLRMAGCNLRCGYCDTPDSLERTARCTVFEIDGEPREVDNPLDVERLLTLLAPFLSTPGLHAVAVTGGEPLVQAAFLADLLERGQLPVPVLLETNGTHPDRLELVLPYVDIVSMDVKLPSNSGEPPLWDRHRAFLAKSIGKTVYVKVPVDEQTLDEEVQRAAALVAAADPAVVLYLQPIVSSAAVSRVSPARLERFYDIATRELREVRVLPQAHKILGIP